MRVTKIYCIKCNNYRKFEDPKILQIFYIKLVLSTICGICDNKDKKKFKEEESLEV